MRRGGRKRRRRRVFAGRGAGAGVGDDDEEDEFVTDSEPEEEESPPPPPPPRRRRARATSSSSSRARGGAAAARADEFKQYAARLGRKLFKDRVGHGPDTVDINRVIGRNNIEVKATRKQRRGLDTGVVDIQLAFQLKRGARFQDVLPALTKELAQRGMNEMRRQARGRRDQGVIIQFGIKTPTGPPLYLTPQIDATQFKTSRRNHVLDTNHVENVLTTQIKNYITQRMADDADDQSPPLEAFLNVGVASASRGRRDQRLNAFREADTNTDQLVRELTATGHEARLVLRIIVPPSPAAPAEPYNKLKRLYGAASARGLMILRGFTETDRTATKQLENTRKVLRTASKMDIATAAAHLDPASKRHSKSHSKPGTRQSKTIPKTELGGCFWFAWAARYQFLLPGNKARQTYIRLNISPKRSTIWKVLANKFAKEFALKVRQIDPSVRFDQLWDLDLSILARFGYLLDTHIYMYHVVNKNLLFRTNTITKDTIIDDPLRQTAVFLLDDDGTEGHICAYEPAPHAFVGHRQFWCPFCGASHSKAVTHKCIIHNVLTDPDNHPEGGAQCRLCKQVHRDSIPSSSNEIRLHCPTCNILLPITCLTEHAKHYCLPCYKYCGDCNQRLNHDRAEEHECHTKFCRNCWKHASLDHICFMQPLKEKPPQRKVIAFDCECYLDPHEEDPQISNHNVALIMATYLYDVPEYATGGAEWSSDQGFFSFTSVHDFLEWLVRPIHTDYVVYAHNMSGYDGHLILRGAHTHDPKLEVRNMIFQGSRIMRFEFTKHKITFGDSARLMPSTLANLPKMFGFDDSQAKGHFPYKFCTTANKDYKGILPPLSYYIDPTMQSPQAIEEIKQWHEEEIERRIDQLADPRHPRQVMFDLQEEMRTYCRQDVVILVEALKRFQDMFCTITHVDPLQKVTIASTAIAVYRTSFMHDIADNAFAQMGPIEQKFCRQAYKGGMTEVMKLFCDFQATGHEGHYADICSSYPNVMRNRPMPIGAPEWIEDPQVEDFHSWFGMVDCEVTCPNDLLLPILPERREVRVDTGQGFTYPSSKLEFNLFNKEGTWTTPELALALQHGYTITKVHAVLNWPRRGTHLFASYIDTFILLKDIGSGPKPPHAGERYEQFRVKIEEDMKMDKQSPLYKRLCKLLLDWIQNSSEYSMWLNDEYDSNDLAQLATIMSSYKNPGLRGMSKLCLNSLYGKFGQQPLKHKTEAIYTYADLHKVLKNPSNIVKDLLVLTGDERVGYVKYLPHANDLQYRAEALSLPHIAAFVTAYARLDLWQRAYASGLDNVCYMDTDSVIARTDPSNPLPYENKLGGWEQENTSPITKMVALAPKTYCLKFADGKQDCHSKGWTHTQALTEMFDFDFFKRTLQSTTLEGQVFPTVRFQNNGKHSIQTIMLNKRLRPVLSKRCLHKIKVTPTGELLEVTTIPHGHQDCPHTRDGVVHASEIHTPFNPSFTEIAS